MIQIRKPVDEFQPAKVTGITPESLAADTLRNLLADYGVVHLEMERALRDSELQSVVKLFGPIKEPVGRTKDGGMFRYDKLRQTIDSGMVMTDEIRELLGDTNFGALDDQRPGLFETFHCDDTYTERPARATVLHARKLPPSGGGPTCFLDMRAAYENLDDATKAQIENLRVAYAYNNEDAFASRQSARGPAEALVDVLHPLVRRHPVADSRALFLDLDRAKHIEGMPIDDGRALLLRLQSHAEATAPQCQHHWHDHDVLAWDNASVQHKARGNFKVGEPRLFWRYMVDGEAPMG